MSQRMRLAMSCGKGRKSFKIRDQGSASDPAQCDRLDLRFGRFFLRPILEYDMATLTRSQRLLVSAGAAALGGTALATLLVGNIVTLAGAGATAVDRSAPLVGPDFPICPTPATALPNMMLRLAQTEVPRAEMSA